MNKDMPVTDPPIVELANIVLKGRSGGTVFSDLSLSLNPGFSAFITGPAGSGKTSMIDLILGRRAPESGAVEVFGQLVKPKKKRQLTKLRAKIGGVGGPFELIPLLTVAKNIELPLIINGERKKIRQERLQKSLSDFSILKQANLYPSELTRVENTMVQLARASVAGQSLLLIDEPLAGLDSRTYSRILEHLFKIVASGRSMIILGSAPPTEKLPQTIVKSLVEGELK